MKARQFWPVVVAAYELVIGGLIIFGVIDPSPDQVAYLMGIPAALAGAVVSGVPGTPVAGTHAAAAVLEALEDDRSI